MRSRALGSAAAAGYNARSSAAVWQQLGVAEVDQPLAHTDQPTVGG